MKEAAISHFPPMRDFKGLKVWGKAHALLLNCHRILRRFPREYSSLRTQLRKSAESISGNIVEGCGCDSQKEFARYLQHSINSSNETEYWLRVSFDYGIIHHRHWQFLTKDTEEVRKMLFSLRRTVLRDSE